MNFSLFISHAILCGSYLLHLGLVFPEHALQAFTRIEQHAALLVQEEQQRGAAVIHIGGKYLAEYTQSQEDDHV